MNIPRRKTRSRITLAAVASHAGVSLSTASFVLNGKGDQVRISQDTHNRVIAAAAALDYTPNLLVKSMQSGRTNVILNDSVHREQGIVNVRGIFLRIWPLTLRIFLEFIVSLIWLFH